MSGFLGGSNLLSDRFYGASLLFYFFLGLLIPFPSFSFSCFLMSFVFLVSYYLISEWTYSYNYCSSLHNIWRWSERIGRIWGPVQAFAGYQKRYEGLLIFEFLHYRVDCLCEWAQECFFIAFAVFFAADLGIRHLVGNCIFQYLYMV